MGTTADKLNRLISTKEAIKEAINNKGVTVTDTDTFHSYASKIATIDNTKVVEPLTVTPTTAQQTITVPTGVTGYSPITVDAVTAEIDPNILAENIRAGVTILGVTGTLDGSTEAMQEIDNLLETLYPVGSVYLGTQNTCPMASLISGSSWVLVSSGKALWTGTGYNANTTIEAGLPNIISNGVGDFSGRPNATQNGALSITNLGGDNVRGVGTSWYKLRVQLDASKSNAIYGRSNTVQPPAYVINVWRRTA